MKYILITICCASLSLLCHNCNNKRDEAKEKVNLNTHQLKKKGTKKFQLDSLTSYKIISSLQYFREGNTDYFSFLNSQTSSIYLYDYNSIKLKKIIKIPKEGPNSISFPINHCFIKNLDSVFVFSLASPYFYLINHKATLLRKYTRANWSNAEKYVTKDSVFVEVNDGRTALVLNKYIYLMGGGLYEGKLHGSNSITLKIDLETGKSYKLTFSYPKLYQEKYFGRNFGLPHSINIYRTYNPKNNQFIHSFPATTDIYVTDIECNKVMQFYAGSDECTEVKPLTEKEAEIFTKSSFRDRTAMNSRCFYHFMEYNLFQDYYYRMVYLPEKDPEKIKSLPWLDRKFSFIFLDKNFQKIGEQDLTQRYRMYSLVHPNGIHLIHDDLEDEDLLVFDIFELVKK